MTQASVSEISELVEYLGAGFVTVLTERICIYIYVYIYMWRETRNSKFDKPAALTATAQTQKARTELFDEQAVSHVNLQPATPSMMLKSGKSFVFSA